MVRVTPRQVLRGCLAAILGVTAIAAAAAVGGLHVYQHRQRTLFLVWWLASLGGALRMLTAMSRPGVRVPAAVLPVASVAGPIGADGH